MFKTTTPKTSTKQSLSTPKRLVLIAVAVIFWAQCLSLMVTTNGAWWLFKGRLARLEEYQVAASLFNADDATTYDLVAVGDALFLKQIEDHLADDLIWLPVLIPRYDARDLNLALLALQHFEVQTLVLQGSPYLWSDLDYNAAQSGTPQDIELWQQRGKHSYLPLPRDNVKLFFKTVQAWAARPSQNQVIDDWRPSTLERLSLDLEPFPRLARTLQNLAKKRQIFLVDDRFGLDIDSNPHFISEFEAAVRNEQIPVGSYIEFNDLTAAINQSSLPGPQSP